MRLWHQRLIPLLPRQQLLGQHRECCALRGNGWGKPHATVNYVFEHPYAWLYEYHLLIMQEMQNRGYNTDPKWKLLAYRGRTCAAFCDQERMQQRVELMWHSDCCIVTGTNIYREHNSEYLKECLDNLLGKGIHIELVEEETNINEHLGRA